jgi:BioD-like phosphotransacetylase family protein
MKSLYVTSVSTFSGKTALALGLGLRMQAAGMKVGYLKPVSTQPY